MTFTRLAVAAALLMLPPAAASAQKVPSAKDALLYIISPADGETVTGPFWCRFGLRNMGITHAGDGFANSGHHHLLIDVSDPLDPKEPIPHDRKHLHFGAGETEALVELPLGKHTLQLVLSDARHYNFDPPVVSKKITIEVAKVDVSIKRTQTARGERGRGRAHRRAAHVEARKPAANAEPAPATANASGPIEMLGRVFGGAK
jgi:hypothetical protein